MRVLCHRAICRTHIRQAPALCLRAETPTHEILSVTRILDEVTSKSAMDPSAERVTPTLIASQSCSGTIKQEGLAGASGGGVLPCTPDITSASATLHPNVASSSGQLPRDPTCPSLRLNAPVASPRWNMGVKPQGRYSVLDLLRASESKASPGESHRVGSAT